MTPRKRTHAAVQLLIELSDVEPMVWRRLLVPDGINLGTFHDMLQVTMGWSDSHLHSFLIGGRTFGEPDDDFDEDFDEERIDEASVSLHEALAGHQRFEYEYDFGDGWTHQLTVEAVLPLTDRLRFAICLGGQQACPPEDVGGPVGYRDFLSAMADPAHEEHADYMAWIGGAFDPLLFDIGQPNVALQMIR
jgi:Plasmid pRiA4b ORF-3-like protein